MDTAGPSYVHWNNEGGPFVTFFSNEMAVPEVLLEVYQVGDYLIFETLKSHRS